MMWSKCVDSIIDRRACARVCVCVYESHLSISLSNLLSKTPCCRIEMQFFSLVFELPTSTVLMAADGHHSSTYSFCCLLMYAALLKHYSLFYDVAGGGGKCVYFQIQLCLKSNFGTFHILNLHITVVLLIFIFGHEMIV